MAAWATRNIIINNSKLKKKKKFRARCSLSVYILAFAFKLWNNMKYIWSLSQVTVRVPGALGASRVADVPFVSDNEPFTERLSLC